MKFKFNASVPNTTEARKFYQTYMKGEVWKASDDGSVHQYVKIFGTLSLHMHNKGEGKDNLGVLVVRFEDKEVDLYHEAIELVKTSKDITVVSEIKAEDWGTSLFKFRDPFGWLWAYEISTKALDDK